MNGRLSHNQFSRLFLFRLCFEYSSSSPPPHQHPTPLPSSQRHSSSSSRIYFLHPCTIEFPIFINDHHIYITATAIITIIFTVVTHHQRRLLTVYLPTLSVTQTIWRQIMNWKGRRRKRRGVIWDTAPEFVSSDCGKPRKTSHKISDPAEIRNKNPPPTPQIKEVVPPEPACSIMVSFFVPSYFSHSTA